MERSLVKNAADEEQVKEAAKKEKSGRQRELADVEFVLSTLPGRRFLWRLLSQCGVFRSSWDPSAKIHFNEGQRNIGLGILADINEANPQAYLTMMLEAKDEEEQLKPKKKGRDEDNG